MRASARSEAEAVAVRAARDQLSVEFPTVPSASLDDLIAHELHRYDDATVRDFVPMFVQRAVRDGLRAARA